MLCSQCLAEACQHDFAIPHQLTECWRYRDIPFHCDRHSNCQIEMVGDSGVERIGVSNFEDTSQESSVLCYAVSFLTLTVDCHFVASSRYIYLEKDV